MDIDECKLMGPCSQMCDNTIGPFRCSCHDYFILATDETTCKEMGRLQMVFFTLFNEIRKISMVPQSLDVLFDGEDNFITDLDVDMKIQKVFFAMLGDDRLMEIEAANGTSTSLLIPTAMRITYDWVSGNVYIVHHPEDMRTEIHVCNMKTKGCAMIQKLHFYDQVPSIQVEVLSTNYFSMSGTALGSLIRYRKS